MIEQSSRGRAGSRAAVWVTAALALAISAPVSAEERAPRPSHNLYGMTGLIDMPTGEMQPDAQFAVTAGYFDGFLRTTLSAQVLPWVEGAFRYSALELLGTGDDDLFDQSFDVKLRLVEEGPSWPGVAVGLQDFLGTGVYGGEYLAATKRFLGGEIKVTGGLGWGRLAGANPLPNPICEGHDGFCDRDRQTGEGGNVELKSFFAGEDLGLFGGVEWQTPLDGLAVKAEYSDDDYSREQLEGAFERSIPVNVGVEYRVQDGVEIGAYYMYGRAAGVRLTLSGNPFRPLAEADLEPAPMPVEPRPDPLPATVAAVLGEAREVLAPHSVAAALPAGDVASVEIDRRDGARWAVARLRPSADLTCPEDAALAIDAEYGVLDAVSFENPNGAVVCTVALRQPGRQAMQARARANQRRSTRWYGSERRRAAIVEALAAELDPNAIGLFGIELFPERATVYIENRRFRAMPRAIGRTARALTRTMPPSVELFEIVPVEHGLPVVSVMLQRSALEDFVERPDGARSVWLTAEVDDVAPVDWSTVRGTLDQFPRPYWSVNPFTPLNVFDPDQPFRADLAVRAEAGLEILPGLSVNAAVQKRLIGDLDQIERESDSELPRVRSDLRRYLREGDPGIWRLTGDHVMKLDEALYGRVSAGLLEWMHGGVSGELLWKPATQTWGVGAELNWTRQRDFEMLFGFQDYDVVTGHLSLYWDTGFHGVGTQIDAGRYLAGDWGGTFTAKRRFENGWEFGGFFTLTDVPFDEFGEGSFDKGLFLTIPFNWALPFESRSEYRAVIQPLTRDGGQRLQIANRLYPMVEDMDVGGLRSDWDSFWR